VAIDAELAAPAAAPIDVLVLRLDPTAAVRNRLSLARL